MKYVKFAMIATSVLAVALSINYGLLGLGGQGIFVLICCAVPGALGTMGVLGQKYLPRWAAVVSALSFVLVAMKTSGGPKGNPLENVMMLGALGLILAIVLAIKPGKAA